MNISPARTRFAPSPTGLPHIGNMRTALYAWLLARHTNGSFILRVEDTDRGRLDAEAVPQIMEALRWLGLNWDEGPDVGGPHEPYIQSERKELYIEAAGKMLENGSAYLCNCTPERLAELRQRQLAAKKAPGYDGHCRHKPRSEMESEREKGAVTVVRYHVPETGGLILQDTVYGEISFELSHLTDFVILKSDGMPTYHLAHVLDDYLMGVTHVIRAEEWISSVPRHILIQKSLQLPQPVYIHVPLLLGKDKAKLSKRHGATTVLEYKEQGYLPEALRNYIALLGWSTGDDEEIISEEDIVRRFTPDRIQAHPAIFSVEKLNWMNGIYIRMADKADLAERVKPYLERPEKEGGLPDIVKRPLDVKYLEGLMPLIQERLHRLDEAAGMLDIFFVEKVSLSEEILIARGPDKASVQRFLEAAASICEGAEVFSSDELEAKFRSWAEDANAKVGVFFYPVRIAATGRKAAPPLFGTLSALGRDVCVERIFSAMKLLKRS